MVVFIHVANELLPSMLGNGHVRIIFPRTRISWQELGFHGGLGSVSRHMSLSPAEDLLGCRGLDGPHQLGERFTSVRSVAEVAIAGPWVGIGRCDL